MRQLDYFIEEAYDGVRVEDYLMRTHGFSRRIVSRLKREPEHIRLNGTHVRMVDILHTGDTLTVILDETSRLLPNGALNVPIVYEDDDLILFNKPHGMPVHPSIAHYEDTLGNFFTYHMQTQGQDLLFRPVNRLDANTTGLCLVAKHALSAKLLAQSVDKQYTAVLCGLLPNDSGIINAPIARESDTIIKRRVSPDGQPSITEYTVERRANGYTLVRVHLLTGRTHQIRVHFSHLGYPLAGDDLYGGSTRDLPHQALCCNRLTFTHPTTHQAMTFCINLPKEIEKLIN